MAVTKRRTTMTLDPVVVVRLQEVAREDERSLSQVANMILAEQLGLRKTNTLVRV